MIEKCGQKIKRPGEVKRGTKEQNIANTIDEETGDWTLDTGFKLFPEDTDFFTGFSNGISPLNFPLEFPL